MKNYILPILLLILFSNCGSNSVDNNEANPKNEIIESKDNSVSLRNDYSRENLKSKVKWMKSVEFFYSGSTGKITNDLNETAEYNNEGNRIKTSSYSSNGKLIDNAIYTYANGKVANKVWYNPTETITEKSNFVYNESGILNKVINTKIKNGLITTLLLEYDNEGNETTNAFSTSDFSLDQKAEMLYNEKKQMVKQTIIRDGFCGAIDEFTYNDNGDKIVEVIQDCSGKISVKKTYEYTYDKFNNWTQRIEFEEKGNEPKSPSRIIKRQINYY